MDPTKIGIYVNIEGSKVVRITSPYWIPEKPDWLLITNDPNATLVKVRDTIKNLGLMPDVSRVQWTNLPLRD